jgi:hypothetical protein
MHDPDPSPPIFRNCQLGGMAYLMVPWLARGWDSCWALWTAML